MINCLDFSDSVIDDGALLFLPQLQPITLDEYMDLALKIQSHLSSLDVESFSLVFGSVAKNSLTPSDLDLIIVSDLLSQSIDYSTDYFTKTPQDSIADILDLDLDRYYLDIKVISKTKAQTSEFWIEFNESQLDPEFLGNVLTKYYLVQSENMIAYETPRAFANSLGIQEETLGL
jgi:predicted nucleotidyltransferase